MVGGFLVFFFFFWNGVRTLHDETRKTMKRRRGAGLKRNLEPIRYYRATCSI